MFLIYRIRIFAISGFVLVMDVDMVVFGLHVTLFSDSIVFTIILNFRSMFGSWFLRRTIRFLVYLFILVCFVSDHEKKTTNTISKLLVNVVSFTND